MNLKKLVKTLLYPPVWVIITLTVLSATALTFVFIKGAEESPIAYVSYVIAFYTLTVISLLFATVLPRKYKDFKAKIYTTPIASRYMTDMVFRAHISLYISLGANLLYVGVNLLSFVLYRSLWFIVLALYYVILAVMRFLLLRYVRRKGIGSNRSGELKRTMLCSFILLTVNFVLSGAVLMILYQDRGFNYHGILIYVMAAYTFYITTYAVINIIKYRKLGSPVMMTSKIIALSAALVSMLSLETAMFSQFGQDMSPQSKRLMIALTGAGVSIAVVSMSVYMIIKSAKEIRKIKEIQNGSKRR